MGGLGVDVKIIGQAFMAYIVKDGGEDHAHVLQAVHRADVKVLGQHNG